MSRVPPSNQTIWGARHRFYKNVDRSGDCWLWTGTHNKSPKSGGGYGQFTFNGKRIGAHRFAWMIPFDHDDIPNGMQICHHCDNPRCVRPSHLFLCTPTENMQDMRAKGRHYKRERMERA